VTTDDKDLGVRFRFSSTLPERPLRSSPSRLARRASPTVESASRGAEALRQHVSKSHGVQQRDHPGRSAYTTAQSTYVLQGTRGVRHGASERLSRSARSPRGFRWGGCASGAACRCHDDGRKSRSDRVATRDRGATRLRGYDGRPGMPVFNGGAPRSDAVQVQLAIAARSHLRRGTPQFTVHDAVRPRCGVHLSMGQLAWVERGPTQAFH